MAGKPGWHHTAEAREKIAASKRGKKRPDVAERNKTTAMRDLPRAISDTARAKLVSERTIHGHARRRGERGGTHTYYIWAAMIQRCTNPKNRDWRLYGARGITVCDRWRIFENFLADMGPRPPGLSIDRIDNDGPYELANCRWATPLQQAHNKRPKVSP